MSFGHSVVAAATAAALCVARSALAMDARDTRRRLAALMAAVEERGLLAG